MIMCVLLCNPVCIHMLQLLSTGRPISSFLLFWIWNFARLQIKLRRHIDTAGEYAHLCQDI